jgi:hypothetical protein
MPLTLRLAGGKTTLLRRKSEFKVQFAAHYSPDGFEDCNEYPNSHFFTSVLARFEVFTAVTTKNAVFKDVRTQFAPHRKHQFSAKEPSPLMLCKI